MPTPPSPSFDFSQYIPGFDFLKNLATGAQGTAVPGLSNWIAPTFSAEEVDKRLQELKAVQFWLEQNLHALKATVQALEVQKMTLATLRSMNVQMEDAARRFGAASDPAAATEAPEAATPSAQNSAANTPGVADPLQWWGALTRQFQGIASETLRQTAQVAGASPAPASPQPSASKTKAKAPPAKKAARKTPNKSAAVPRSTRSSP